MRESVRDLPSVVGTPSDGGGGESGVGSTASVAVEAVSDERKLQQLVEIAIKFEDSVTVLTAAGGDMVMAVDLLRQ
ncbi:hypothetical protein BWQ96_10664 [Gracilariopsis chorda]|uniref:Uncharacterized protein n=1 Tax=Gracilariopsis chorda TaxID=448386 RepID=A0A2V3IC44_9FLOR|nr:hypothetical protein BWQ96_10664 [Gracilariopsis chorda]|eukprot:PXF39641.1 hypothetical protein BWQ96_10664 [Gracilariopsis chorda]